MAHIHNAILRGYNSIYLQAPHVKDVDKAAFVGYALTWYRFVKSHHDDEENELFPAVEQVLNDKEIWGETHKEHGMFIHHLRSHHLPHPLIYSFFLSPNSPLFSLSLYIYM
jgi:hemerythrin-like domain-containing protein